MGRLPPGRQLHTVLDFSISSPRQLWSPEPCLPQPLFGALSSYKLVTIVKYGAVSLYFHRKEFRRINLNILRNSFSLAFLYFVIRLVDADPRGHVLYKFSVLLIHKCSFSVLY